MSEKTSKFKVNMQEGTIEVEGSEEFVKEMLREYKTFFESVGKPQNNYTQKKSEKKDVPTRKRTRSSESLSFAPIPVDLKAKGDAPSLRDLYAEKNPTSNYERTTLFVYYLDKYKNIKDVLSGHLISCYDEVGARKPKRPDQSIRDVTHDKGWLKSGTTAGSANITIAGENYIEHDLPKKN